MRKVFWLASAPLCRKRLRAALPQGRPHYESLPRPLAPGLRQKLLALSPAQIDRLLRPGRVRHPRRGLATTKPGSRLRQRLPTRGGPPDPPPPGPVAADTVAHCGDTTAGDFVYSLTFTDLSSGGTENRAVGNKGTKGILDQLKDLAAKAPFALKSCPADNGSEFLNWALYEHLTGRPVQGPFTRSRAYRKNDNAHCEQKHDTLGRQRGGPQRFEPPELGARLNDLYGQAGRQDQNHCRPTFKLLSRDKRGRKTGRRYAALVPPCHRLRPSRAIPKAMKARLRAEHARLNPFLLKKAMEEKRRKFFPLLGNLERESTKP